MSAEEKQMDSNKAPRSAKELRDALVSFTADPADEAEMSDEEVDAYLHDAGIDIAPQWTRVQETVKDLQGQERLERAREARERDAGPPQPAPSAGLVSNVRAEIQRLLNQLGGRQLQLAFRSLDEATEDDLLQVLSALQALAADVDGDESEGA